MVLSSDGEILTNNHVVEGASQIVVTVVTTGESYRASIVGTDPEDDVAVLQLTGASDLQTIPLGDSDTVQVGDQVAAIGNAGGVGGTPTSPPVASPPSASRSPPPTRTGATPRPSPT